MKNAPTAFAIAAPIFVFALSAAAALPAQTPRLVSDFVPGSRGVSPRSIRAFGDKVFFYDASNRALHVSDGTASGTKRLGALRGIVDIFAGPKHVFVFTGRELWVSDGSGAGTTRIKSFGRGFTSSIGQNVASLGDSIYFPVDDGRVGAELWKSDGTAAGTRLVKDIHPSRSSSPSKLFSDGRRIWFAAYHPTAGLEPFTTDGTAANTKLVADINPGSNGSRPFAFVKVGSAVLFHAYDTSVGMEPRISDARGTRLVAELRAGASDARPGQMVEMDGNAYFVTSADRGFWKTDGTSAGISKVVSLRGTPFGRPFVAGHRVFFKTIFSTLLWGSDGTTTGTKIFSGVDTSFFEGVGDGRAAFVSSSRAPTGAELWLTDGTTAGTKAFEVVAGPQSSAASSHVRVGNRIYFSAWDAVHGEELRVLENVAVGDRRASACSPQRFYASPPVLGASTQIEARGLATNQIGVVMLGRPLPTGVAVGACRIWVDFAGVVLLPYLPTKDSYSVSLPVPMDSALGGAALGLQNVQIVSQKLVFGPGRQLRIGY